MKRYFTPNESVQHHEVWLIIASWVVLWLGYWSFFHPVIFPSPLEVLSTFPDLWFKDGLGQEAAASFFVNLQALILSTVVALPLAYLSLVPVMRPLAIGVSKLRFLSPAVFFLILIFLASSGHEVKVLMLALGELFFLVTTMITLVTNIPTEEFDDARTLHMNEWEVTWYAVVRGTLAGALEAIRDNAAMGFSMCIMVEGFIRSEGGVGVMLINQERHMNFAEVYAIAGLIVIVGLGQDAVLGWIRKVVCPYVEAQ